MKRINFWALVIFCSFASMGSRLCAQTGCWSGTGSVIGYQCCSGLKYWAFPNGGDYFVFTQWGYCGCNGPTSVEYSTVQGYCQYSSIRAPGDLEKFWMADPSGRLLIASCTGELIPLPQVKEEPLARLTKRPPIGELSNPYPKKPGEGL
jgi:hypothetical protein